MNGLLCGRRCRERVHDLVAGWIVNPGTQPDHGQFIVHGAADLKVNRVSRGNALLIAVSMKPRERKRPVGRDRGGVRGCGNRGVSSSDHGKPAGRDDPGSGSGVFQELTAIDGVLHRVVGIQSFADGDVTCNRPLPGGAAFRRIAVRRLRIDRRVFELADWADQTRTTSFGKQRFMVKLSGTAAPFNQGFTNAPF